LYNDDARQANPLSFSLLVLGHKMNQKHLYILYDRRFACITTEDAQSSFFTFNLTRKISLFACSAADHSQTEIRSGMQQHHGTALTFTSLEL